eukprot:gb/GFBE01062245.1/.p1 GENE.gb/GFBE01062245.1/~~gb/GFBE01062245.1/.p1  ORF type:complete len:103 (+),score=20.63 gb/GFBE01062245.1/:1-309(+)
MACFLTTFAPQAISQLTRCFEMYPVSLTCLYLNGAANAGVYMWWVRRARAHSDGLALEMMEDSMIDAYFDLYISSDEATVAAMRTVAVSVAQARDIETLEHE